jgi:Zn-dependent membrane protease YugP
MNLTIDFGHSEVLLICGTILTLNGILGFGITLMVLGILSALLRAGMKIQKDQQAAAAKEQRIKDMNFAGEELSSAVLALIGAFSKGNKKSNHGNFH